MTGKTQNGKRDDSLGRSGASLYNGPKQSVVLTGGATKKLAKLNCFNHCAIVNNSIALGGSVSADFKFIDSYLKTWDRFAQGAKELGLQIKQDAPRFQQLLALALSQGDKRAPSRLIFYAVVQVGGFIPCDSELGRACERYVSDEVAVFSSKKDERMYFAGDLYFWWERHKAEHEAFPLYEEWSHREFAKKTVIPMYESAAKTR